MFNALSVAIVMVTTSISALPTPSSYGPAFYELGTDTASDAVKMGPQVVVNRFGGNLMAQATDIDLPSMGDFSLRMTRTHNSGGEKNTNASAARRRDSPLGMG